ncbi:hypothetical protein OVY01_22585 [Robbsia sp. Bb-Pol-6]|uniref:Uncharacterized protein n=1 Tax=Robbsia betulipollinis TaxID=2981849 RepID=A0ABT3ZVK6_9BURK|nr:hypothetical protein [Robbsia betulipollinis]MCY0389930.1 hypothetical protein [Robbsia betulipollinis]
MSAAIQNRSNSNGNVLKDGLPQLQMVNGVHVQRLDEATLERHGLTGPVYITPSAAVSEGLDQAMA